MSDIKALGTITVAMFGDGTMQIFSSAHPHNCDLEKFIDGICTVLHATIEAQEIATPPAEQGEAR